MSKKRISIFLATAVIAGLTGVQDVSAQGVTQYHQVRQRQPKQKKMALMPGDVAKENIQKVTSEIRWNTNLNSALAQAHRQNKMVFWVHLVGNLSGAT